MNVDSLHQSGRDRSLWRVGDVLDGRYRVSGVLGSGGMGEVYLVRHLEWAADLAVKSPHAHLFADDRHRELFVAEAETWVSLGLHPNVCGCHYVQVIGGVPRVFAEYVPGGSLHDLIDGGDLYRGSSVDLRVLDLAIQAARGLAHAHRRGVAHLDVKPANILLDAEGTAKITDFGLARAARDAQATQFTNPGLMTRAYASPEQADGRPVGRASDVYSLAATVLEMFLRERTWMIGAIAAEVLAAERGSLPDAVAGLLERCLAHDPGDRPAMDEVAAGLSAIYTDLSGVLYPRTEPVPASLLADELNNRALSLLDLDRPAEAEAAFTQALDIDPRHLESTFNRALLRWRRGEITDLDVLGAVAGACPDSASGGTAQAALLARVHRERGDIASATGAPPPEPKTDRSGPRSPLPARVSGDGTRVLTGSPEGGMRLWDLAEGRLLARLVAPRSAPVHSLDITADARFALSAHDDNSLRYWDLARRKCVREIEAPADEPRLTSSGGIAVWTLPEGAIRLWDTASGSLTDSAVGHAEGADRLEVTGLIALTSGWEPAGTAVRLWDLATRECLAVLAEHDASVTAMRFAPGGQTAAIARSDGTVELWDLHQRGKVAVLRGAALPHLAFDPAGRHLLTGSESGTIQLWDLAAGRLLRTFEHVAEQVSALHLGTRAVYAVTARHRQEMHVTTLEPGLGYRARPALSRPRGHVELAALDARTRDLVARARTAMGASEYGPALALLRQARAVPGHSRDPLVLDAWRRLGHHTPRTGLRGGWPTRSLSGPGSPVSAVGLSADGRVAAAGDHDGIVHVWDTGDGSLLHRWEAHLPHLVASVCLSPDGQTVLTSARGSVRVWRAGECVRVLPAFALHDHVPIALTPDGARALVGGGDGLIHLWDLAGDAVTLAGHTGAVGDLAVSADGHLAVSAGADKTVRVWDLASGACVRVLEGHDDEVSSVSVSPDGRHVLGYAGRFRAALRAWDHAGAPRWKAAPPERTLGVGFVNGGRFALSADRAGALALWDPARGEVAGTVATGPSTVFATDAEGDLVISAREGAVRLWRLDWELADGRDING